MTLGEMCLFVMPPDPRRKRPAASTATAPTRTARQVRERPPAPVLLDTSVLIWWMCDPARLSRLARATLTSPPNGLLISAVSFWEIGAKVRRGRLDLGASFDDFVGTVQSMDSVSILAVDLPTWLDVIDLDWDHGDPADRIIVATAQRHRATLVSSNRAIRAFYSEALW